MKKLLLLSAVICFSIADFTAQIAWSSPIQIDDDAGTFPKLSFDPNGRLLVFYYDIQRDSMLLKKEKTPAGTLSSGISVAKAGKNIGIHYSSAEQIDLMVSKTTAHTILQSSDSGSTWTAIKTFASTSNVGSPNTMGGAFTENGSDLRLFYSYVTYSAVTGDKPQTFELKRTGNVWDASGTFISDGGVTAAYENDLSVCVIGTRYVFQSVNDGNSYTEINPGAAFPDRLNATGADEWNGTLFLSRDYSSLNNHLTFSSSTDFGVNWLSPQVDVIPPSNIYNSYSKIAVNGDTMVVCWVQEQSTQPGILGYKLLLSSYSTDGGLNFSVPDTVFTGTDFKVIVSSLDDNRIDFDLVNYRNRFVVAYAAVLNNLANNQHTYIREINFPNVSPPVTDVKESYENENIVLYPNPANAEINLTLLGNGSYDIVLSDCQGKALLTMNGIQGSQFINVQHLTNGLYFLKLTSEGSVKAYKFAINR